MIRRVAASFQAAARAAAISGGRAFARLGNADTALFAGWAMVTTGCGLVSLPAGLIVGGLFLMGGALFTARGSE